MVNFLVISHVEALYYYHTTIKEVRASNTPLCGNKRLNVAFSLYIVFSNTDCQPTLSFDYDLSVFQLRIALIGNRQVIMAKVAMIRLYLANF